MRGAAPPAAEQPRPIVAAEISRGKAPRRLAEHREVGLAVPDSDRLASTSDHPVAQRAQPGALVEVARRDGRIDGSLIYGKPVELEFVQHLLDEKRRERRDGSFPNRRCFGGLEQAEDAERPVAIGESANRITVARIEKYAWDVAQCIAQALQLFRSFLIDQRPAFSAHGVPDVSAVFGYATGQSISFAIALHFGDRARRIERDRAAVPVECSEGGDPGRADRRESENPTINDAVDIKQHQRRPPGRRRRRTTETPSKARRLDRQSMPSRDEPA